MKEKLRRMEERISEAFGLVIWALVAIAYAFLVASLF